MNREIKFRGKMTKDGQWFYGYYVRHLPFTPAPLVEDIEKYKVELLEKMEHFIVVEGFSDWNMPRDMSLIKIDKDTICEYTGFKDKNGKEIYEGDIIQFISDTNEAYNMDIKFINGCFKAHWSNPNYVGEDTYECNDDDLNFEEDCEIIGNIYENPELINK